MAFQSDNTLISNREMLTEMVMTPLRALGRFIVQVAEATAQARALHEVNNMSDATLQAAGLTRSQAFELILSRRDV
ncbi:DUF1127 domain-containing protein [Yoonia sp.]|uniref:DUF1127 domain-containing protein n=1 Tax=Yoonia sp. TaxID=2212373 RepID=UPI003A4D960E|nr:DUF1127 domain-containing protein [Loktanella sp.]